MQGIEVGIDEILDCREKRVAIQNEMIKKYNKPVISFTMNIPGPIKTNNEIKKAFDIGKKLILEKLKEINKKKYSILKLGLFGSFSKNSDTANSDIDILVKMEFKKGMYQNFCNLHKRLEEIFQKKVDLVDESMFEYKFKNPKVQKYKDEIKEEILRSVIYV